MARERQVIVTAALTGSIHTPSMSPHLPVTPDEIVAEGERAARAGAAILHLHARDPETGRPDQSPEAFARILPRLAAETDCILNVTTGGSPFMSVEERLRPVAAFAPELASLNMGSMNFGLYGMLERYRDFAHDWEPEMLEASRDLAFRNTFAEIETVLAAGAANGTRFEFECYDTAHIRNLAHVIGRGLVDGTPFVQTVFGLLGGIGAEAEDVAVMRRMADRYFGDGYAWSVLGAGASQLRIAAMAAAMSGHVRVGLEDSLWAGPGRLATSAAEQIGAVGRILDGLGLAMATPDEARDLLGLKGPGEVNF